MTEKDLEAVLNRIKKKVDVAQSITKEATTGIELPAEIMKDVSVFKEHYKNASKETLTNLLYSTPEKLEELATKILNDHK